MHRVSLSAPGRVSWRIAVASCLWACCLGPTGSASPTPSQNAAAFAAGAAITKQSYHWDAIVDGLPRTATTTRVPLPGASLTTLSWNPVDSAAYQWKTIDSVAVACTLVATFTGPFSTWTAPRGTVTELTWSQGGTTHFLMPWVTAGQTLRDYLRDTYFTGSFVPSPADAQRRIVQSLGMPADEGTTKGLALFWVPLENLARPAYSADIASQLLPLSTYGDGSYAATTVGAPAGVAYLDDGDTTKTLGTISDFVEWNQARTNYPWTAMGYTFNWNALQTSPTDSLLGFDPLAPMSAVGVSEFVVSAGSKIVNEGFVPNHLLGQWAANQIWAIPEIDPAGLGATLALVTAALGLLERRRRKIA